MENLVEVFNSVYDGKKVAVTGHSGFKGSWLSVWLKKLNASVFGFSQEIPTKPSHFELCGLDVSMSNYWGDISHYDSLYKFFDQVRPDFVFHLAAQAIVSESYSDPLNTIQTNALGTATLLKVLNDVNSDAVVIIITSDKCYENIETFYGYRETDSLGGKDIYSASKACAEILTYAFHHSFIRGNSKQSLRLATARAGNVIGGGDWAKDRLVVDAFESWSKQEPVVIRSPKSTRPWQHVLEPLSGYLSLGCELSQSEEFNGHSFNFGPDENQNASVIEIITDLAKLGSTLKEPVSIAQNNSSFSESSLLALNCDKSKRLLKWNPTLSYNETVQFVAEWYNEHRTNPNKALEKTTQQIIDYTLKARSKNVSWAK